jgi:uncharacterized protein
VRYVRAENVIRATVLGTRIGMADRWWLRLLGLLGRERLAAGEGLCLRPCRAVHMLGMSQPLDVVFLDQSGRVVAMYPALAPGDRTGWHSTARDALELPPGTLTATGTREGDTIVCSREEIS